MQFFFRSVLYLPWHVAHPIRAFVILSSRMVVLLGGAKKTKVHSKVERSPADSYIGKDSGDNIFINLPFWGCALALHAYKAHWWGLLTSLRSPFPICFDCAALNSTSSDRVSQLAQYPTMEIFQS